MEREEAERLVARYGPSVYRLAYARTGSKEDAEDVMQETFLRLVRAAPEFRDEEHGKAWLLRVATHCAADVFRMPWRKRDLPLEAARGVSSGTAEGARQQCAGGGAVPAGEIPPPGPFILL